MNIEIGIFATVIGLLVFFIIRKLCLRNKHLKKIKNQKLTTLERKKQNPILYLSSDELMKIQGNLDFVVATNWRKYNPLEKYPWHKILGPDNRKKIDLVGSAYSVDVSLLSYVVVLGCAISRDPKFFTSRLHKEFEKKFITNEKGSVRLSDMNAEIFGIPFEKNYGINPLFGKNNIDASPVVEQNSFIGTINRTRSTARNYAGKLPSEDTQDEKYARLLEITVILRLMSDCPSCHSFVFGLCKKMVETASERIDDLVKQFEVSLKK